MNKRKLSAYFLSMLCVLFSTSAFADSYCQGDNGDFSVNFQVFIARGDMNPGDASGVVTVRSHSDGRTYSARFEQGSVSYNIFWGTLDGSNDNGDSFSAKIGNGPNGFISEMSIAGVTVNNVPVSCR